MILYVNDIIYKKINKTPIIHLLNHTNLHTKTYPHTIIEKFPPNDHHTPLHYYVSVQKYIHPYLDPKNICHFIRSSLSVVGNPLEAPHCIVVPNPLNGNTGNPKHPEGTLVYNHPKKRVKILKVIMFDTLPMEIHSIIDDFITSF